MPEIKEIILDADNTIWSWTKFATKAYPAMAAKIAQETGKSIEAVEQGMKAYYTRTGTIESPWLIQDLQRQGLFDDLNWDQEQIDQLRDTAHKVFIKERGKHFRMYKGFGQALRGIQKRGLKTHIVTDAPTIQACMRVMNKKIGKYLTSLHALKFNDDINEPPPKVKERQSAGYYDVPFHVHELHHEKPDTRLENIIHAIEEVHGNLSDYISNHVAIIGDNPSKDMALARKYDCLGIQAGWGKPTKEEIDIIKRYAPERVVRKNTSTQESENTNGGNIITIGKNSIKKDIYAALGFTNGQ